MWWNSFVHIAYQMWCAYLFYFDQNYSKIHSSVDIISVMVQTVFHRTCMCVSKNYKQNVWYLVVILFSCFVIIMLCLFFLFWYQRWFSQALFYHHKLLYLCLRKKLCEWKKRNFSHQKPWSWFVYFCNIHYHNYLISFIPQGVP